jgi:hypothetical protein
MLKAKNRNANFVTHLNARPHKPGAFPENSSSAGKKRIHKSTESNIARVIYGKRLHAFSWPDAFGRIGAYDLKACAGSDAK